MTPPPTPPPPLDAPFISAFPDEHGGIIVRNVARSFGAVHAVRHVSFDARPGTVTALIGPNGSGKTTLMLMLASLLRPDAGSIRIAGHDPVTHAADVRANLGWMPDVLGSWSALTVRSTLETTARLFRMSRPAATARAAELLVLVGLSELADQPTRVLSRGQKQRLSLARALVHAPKVLLLDEPASGLDPGARVHLREIVRNAAAEGATVLVSSHVLSELDEMADAAVYLSDGVNASAESVAAARQSARPWRITSADRLRLESALLDVGFARDEVVFDRMDAVVPVFGDAAAADLLAKLVATGVRISAFAPAVGELEQTFLDLSSRAEPRHPGPPPAEPNTTLASSTSATPAEPNTKPTPSTSSAGASE